MASNAGMESIFSQSLSIPTARPNVSPEAHPR
uniref:Uncharacterized protein n=1 Tax=Rhizophora mucronata TaxID=61149 RepID=A0A2P2PRZ1_RHIMU